jgi:hypothetical protein
MIWLGDIIIPEIKWPPFDLISFNIVCSFVARGGRVLLAPAETKKAHPPPQLGSNLQQAYSLYVCTTTRA